MSLLSPSFESDRFVCTAGRKRDFSSPVGQNPSATHIETMVARIFAGLFAHADGVNLRRGSGV